MYELVHSNKESPDGTGYNDPPVNFKEMTEKEFAQSQFHSHSPVLVEYRQMIVKDDLSPGKLTNGKMISTHLYWFADDTGIAIAADYWKGKIRYFSFGCNHDLEQRRFTPRCVLPCKKCNTNVHQAWMELIVEDSGWSMDEFSSRPSRGIRDYNRAIKFSRDLDEKEQKSVQKFLAKVNCPGWTGVGMRASGDSTYRFTTTYDSSD
jgi:hypothetical protein